MILNGPGYRARTADGQLHELECLDAEGCCRNPEELVNQVLALGYRLEQIVSLDRCVSRRGGEALEWRPAETSLDEIRAWDAPVSPRTTYGAPLTCPACGERIDGEWADGCRLAIQRCPCGHEFEGVWPGFRFKPQYVAAKTGPWTPVSPHYAR